MKFAEALELIKEGKAVRRHSWVGYWKRSDDSIKMYCRDGRVLDIRETGDVFFTMENIAAEDWEPVDSNPGVPIAVIPTFGFGDAIRRMKQGMLVARRGWNGKGMAVAYQPGYPEGIPCNKNTAETWHMEEGEIFKCRPYLQMRCADGTFQMWLASQSDILADDWYVTK